MPDQNTFMAAVQAHERQWGMQSYAGRPDLGAILQSPVVAFWQMEPPAPAKPSIKTQPRYEVTLHPDLNDIERYLLRAIIRLSVENPTRRLVRVFAGGKEMRVRAVKLEFEAAE